MNNDKTTEQRGRGRPRLTDEEQEQRRIKRRKYDAERLKKSGYSAQKTYRKKNYRECKILIRNEYSNELDALLDSTGLSISELFIGAVEEKYDITLTKGIDKLT